MLYCRLSFRSILLFMLALVLLPYSLSASATYQTHTSQAIQWLVSQQNSDGSWSGTTEAAQYIQTVEAVQALHSVGYRKSAYYKGVTWLENHAADNADYLARRALALALHGDDVSVGIEQLGAAQNAAVSGRSGWGLSADYLQSPIDTALVLVLNSQFTVANTTNTQAAINYLKSAQLINGGWSVGVETVSDPFSTAWVVKALVPLQAQDAALGVVIANGVNALNSSVTTSSPVYLQSLAAHAALMAGNTAIAQHWLTSVASFQSGNGSWSDSVYDTALVLRAFAAADDVDSISNQTLVSVPDARLRAAINVSLGRNAMDSQYRSDLAQVISLDLRGTDIESLNGLQYAVNLKDLYLDSRFIDVSGLTNIAGLNLHYNDYDAVADNVVMQQDQVVSIPQDALLANDLNVQNQILTVTNVVKTGVGTPSLASGEVTFAPFNAAQTGVDIFKYIITGNAGADFDQVNVTITPVGQTIAGTAANEILFGGIDGSAIDSAAGDDVIYGKSGVLNNIYFGKNDGNDVLFLNNITTSILDALHLKSDIVPLDINFEYFGNDLLMRVAGSASSLLVANVLDNPAVHSPKKLIYSSGQQQTAFGINDYIVRPAPDCQGGGNSCSDILRENFSFIPGDLLGNDFEFGSVSEGYIDTATVYADNVSYGPVYSPNCWVGDCFEIKVENYSLPVNVGYDFRDGGAVPGHAVARFALVAGNSFIGTDKNEFITGRDDSDDMLDGQGGKDFLFGGSGSDAIYFGLYDGEDAMQILDWTQSVDKVVIENSLTFDAVAPYDSNAVFFERVGYALVLRVNGSNDKLRLDYFFANSAIANLAPFGRVEFSDGSHAPMYTSDLIAAATYGATLLGTSGNDYGAGDGSVPVVPDLTGTTDNDVIFGFAGNDRIWGLAGNDALYGGDGDDTLFAGSGSDSLYGDDGDDWLWGGSVATDYSGGAGFDTYGIAPVYGQITIDNLDTTTCVSGCDNPNDNIWFEAGVQAAQVAFSREDDDLKFTTTDGSNTSTTTVLDYFTGDNSELDFRFKENVYGSSGNPIIWDGACIDYDANNAVDNLMLLVDADQDGAPDTARIEYDGSRANSAEYAGCMKNKLMRDMSTTLADTITGFASDDWINARDGNDTVNAEDGNDVIHGGEGDDVLDGSWGNDLLLGEAGNDFLHGGIWGIDRLIGGDGSDTYYINADSSEETIADGDSTVSGAEVDVLVYLDGVTANQLWFYLDDTDGDSVSDDLVIQRIGLSNKVIVENWVDAVSSLQNRIENITVQAGVCTELNNSMIDDLLTIMPLKGNSPTQDFTNVQLAPYWSGVECL